MGEHTLILYTLDVALTNFVEDRITSDGLNIARSHSLNNENKTVFVVSANDGLISEAAELWGFLKSERTGLKSEFSCEDEKRYVPPYTSTDNSLFTPSEKSYITHQILKRIKIKCIPDCFPRIKSGILSSDPILLSLERAELGECWPLHTTHRSLLTPWEKGPFDSSFCDHVNHYFGPNIALYFAWLRYYITCLTVSGIIGLLVFLYHYVNPHIDVDNSLVSPIYTAFVVTWGVLFVKGWDRRCAALICEWGIVPDKWRREIRPDFQGIKRISPITGLSERYFPSSRRVIRYFVSFSVTLAMLLVAFFVMVVCLNLQGYIHEYSYSRNYLLIPMISNLCHKGQYFDRSGNGPLPYLLPYLPVILRVVIIQFLNRIYQKIANTLTIWENHLTHSQHENALFIKRFFFEAFDCYIALFYLTFIEKDIYLLRRDLVSLYTVDSIRRLSTETMIPFLSRKAKKYQNGTLAKGGLESVFSEDVEKIEYEQFDDYLEMVIQIGYVTLFAGAFPLAAPLSVVCNVLELYSDTFKLTHVTRRPVVHRITNIGVWSILVKGIILLSIFTNLYIFCYTSEQLLNYAPWLFTVTKLSSNETFKSDIKRGHDIAPGAGMAVVTIVMTLEHLLLLLTAGIWLLVPTIPSFVSDENMRREYVKFITVHKITPDVSGRSLKILHDLESD